MSCVSFWFVHFPICRNKLRRKCYPSMHMRVVGTRKLSCCSWHFMQSHKMTAQKIRVDEFAGKLCVATNHQVFLVYSQLLYRMCEGTAKRPGKFVCALFFFRQDEYDFTPSKSISQCFRIVAHLIATTCARYERAPSIQQANPVHTLFSLCRRRFECVAIFSSQHLSRK